METTSWSNGEIAAGRAQSDIDHYQKRLEELEARVQRLESIVRQAGIQRIGGGRRA